MIDRFGVSQPTRERLKDAAQSPTFLAWMRQQCASWSEFQNQQQATRNELKQLFRNNKAAFDEAFDDIIEGGDGNAIADMIRIEEDDNFVLTTSNGIDGLRMDSLATLVALYFFEERGTAKLIDAKKLSREDRIAHLSALLPAVYGPKPSDSLRTRLRYADEAITRILSEYEPHDTVPEEVGDWRNRMVKTNEIVDVVPFKHHLFRKLMNEAAVERVGTRSKPGYSYHLGQACDAIGLYLKERKYSAGRIADYAAKIQQLK
ncbi:hypothetical protein [Rosistilla oblonga]|uniref:hypothetical protein n=1 Tax=Rosistilla oblonga TaxID=2527990 RepID=UPI003A96F807